MSSKKRIVQHIVYGLKPILKDGKLSKSETQYLLHDKLITSRAEAMELAKKESDTKKWLYVEVREIAAAKKSDETSMLLFRYHDGKVIDTFTCGSYRNLLKHIFDSIKFVLAINKEEVPATINLKDLKIEVL